MEAEDIEPKESETRPRPEAFAVCCPVAGACSSCLAVEDAVVKAEGWPPSTAAEA
jgi:hypothetical protein